MGCICREVIFFLTLIGLGDCSGSIREQCGHAATFTNCKCQVHSANESSKNVSSQRSGILNSSKVELTRIKNDNSTEIKCFVIYSEQNKTESYLLHLVESHKDIFNTCFSEASPLECHCQERSNPGVSHNISFLLTGPANCSQQTKTGSLLADNTPVSGCDKDPPGDPFVNCNNKFVAEGKSLECVCEARFADSRPDDFSLSWPRYSDNSTMKVMKVTRDDNSTVFTCLMTWCGHERTTNYTLHVAYGPDSEHTRMHGPNSFLTDGTLSLNLTCLANEVYPAPFYSWDGVTCQNNDSDQGTCDVKPTPPGDDGRQVECTARSSGGDYNVGTARHKLNLTYPPPQPPYINIINGQTVGGGEIIHCIVSGGKPLVTSVIFTCLTDPPHEDQPDTRTASSVFSSLVIDSAKITENITECVCHGVWELKEEWYSKSTTVVVFIQTQDKAETDSSSQVIIFGAAGGGGALVIVLIIIIIVLASSKTRRKDMYDRRSAWYTYEHKEVTEPQGLTRTEGDYFNHNSAGESARRWRSYTVSQVNSEAHHLQRPHDIGKTFFGKSPRPLAPTAKAVLHGKGASQSCSNIHFAMKPAVSQWQSDENNHNTHALKPPVSQWQSDENNHNAQETVSPYEEDEYTYSQLRENEGATYLNNPSPDDPECLRQEETNYCDIDNSNCLAEDVLPGQGLSISSEFRDNENNRTRHTPTALSGTKDTRAELIKIFESRAKNVTDQSKTNANKGSLENIFIEQSRRKTTLQPKSELLGRRASRSCSNLHLELQKLTPKLTIIDDNNETRDVSTDYDYCYTQTPSESKTNPQDGENNCYYFTLEEEEYSTGYVPSKQGQSTGALNGGEQREIKEHIKPQVSASLHPGKDVDMFAELIKRFEGTTGSATNQSKTTINKGSLQNVLREQSRKKPPLLPKPALRGRSSSRSCSNLLLGSQKLKPQMASVEHHREARGRDMSSDYDDCYCPQTPSESKTNTQNGEDNCYYYKLEENEYSMGHVPLKQGQSTGTLYLGKQRGINAYMKQEVSTHLHPGRGFRDIDSMSCSTATVFSQQEALTANADGGYDSFVREGELQPVEDFSSPYNHISDNDRC